MHVGHSSVNKLPKLELLRALADLDSADFSGPIVNVLEQVAMDSLQMYEVESAVWNSFRDTLADEPTLCSIERSRIHNPKLVFEDLCPGMDVRVAVVHLRLVTVPLSPSRM